MVLPEVESGRSANQIVAAATVIKAAIVMERVLFMDLVVFCLNQMGTISEDLDAIQR